MNKFFSFTVRLLLLIAIPVLVYFIYNSLQQPVRFERNKSAREQVCIERLKAIRTLQEHYKSRYNRFTGDIDSLIDFYHNGTITIIKQIGSMDDSVAVAQKRVFRDSIKIAVKDTLLKEFTLDSLRYIPFSGGKEFSMEAVVAKVSGVDVPLFEASAHYDDLLLGLDRQLIVNLNHDRVTVGRFPGLRVGSIESPNNNAGNWE